MEWMSAKELLEEVKKSSGLIAGMTMSQAAKNLGFSTMANGMLIKPVVSTSTTAQVIQFPQMSASAAYAVGGATATGAATSAAANLTLVNTTAGATTAGASSVAGVLNIAAPIAATAITALLGYKLGNEIYEHNNEFFDGLMDSVMDYVSPGTKKMLGLYTGEAIYIDKRAYDAIKARIDAIPSRIEKDIIPTGLDLNSLKPKIDLASALIDAVNWQISNNGNTDAMKPNFDYDLYIEPIKKYCAMVEKRFPGKLISAYAMSGGKFNSVEVRFKVFDICESYDIYTYTDYDGIERKKIIFTGYSYGEFGTWVDTLSESEPNTYFTIKLSDGTTLRYSGKNNFNSLMNDKESTASYSHNTKEYYPLEPYSEYWSGVNRYAFATNFSYKAIQNLPSGVSKYTPNEIKKVDPIYLVHGWDNMGCPVEVPYIPVRLPSNPTEIPTQNPEDDPSENPDPNTATPYIPTDFPYPSWAPDIEIKPDLTPEENPDNLPQSVPNLVPNTNPEPAIEPNPDVNPSVQPQPLPQPYPVDDPITNPDNSGTTPAPEIPTIPTISSEATGLLHVYNPTNAQINEFGSWLWTTFSGDLIDTISKLFNNPMDGVIGVHELYATPSTGSESTIKCGFLDSNVTSRLVNKRYTEINCGSIIVPEHWGNYLDYAPYTKAHCYLPFIGMVELNADDIIGHAVNITYRIDSYTGACIAIITVASNNYESICYQFPGNCAVEVPITSGMKSVLQSALLGAATTAIGAAVGGAAGAKIGGAVGSKVASTAALRGGAGAVSGAAYGANSKNDVQHSGSFGSSFGAMGYKKPFMVIKRPKQKVVAGYNENYGYPAHKMVTIGECTGYLRAREVDVVSVTATEDEKELIEVALKSGVFVS